jgi:hypothetical protein
LRVFDGFWSGFMMIYAINIHKCINGVWIFLCHECGIFLRGKSWGFKQQMAGHFDEAQMKKVGVRVEI